MKALITYFSVGGTTKHVAEMAAKELGMDVYEIQPLHPYTAADVRYTNPLARCNKEKFGKRDVPVAGKIENFADYDEVFLGFPIWYGAAPNVINTFCKGYEWTGKRVYAFATSGGSGIGKTAEKLKPFVKGAVAVTADLVKSAIELEALR